MMHWILLGMSIWLWGLLILTPWALPCYLLRSSDMYMKVLGTSCSYHTKYHKYEQFSCSVVCLWMVGNSVLASLQYKYRHEAHIITSCNPSKQPGVITDCVPTTSNSNQLNFSQMWFMNSVYRKDLTPTYSAIGCIQNLANITKQQSRDHSILHDIYSSAMCSRLQEVMDDHRRIFNNVCNALVASLLCFYLLVMPTDVKQKVK